MTDEHRRRARLHTAKSSLRTAANQIDNAIVALREAGYGVHAAEFRQVIGDDERGWSTALRTIADQVEKLT